MPDQPSSEKKQSLLSSKDIQVPPISKQTAGAVAGAAIGSVAGPIGAVVGGVVGALAGKAASGERPITRQDCETERISAIANSKIAQANGTRVAQIDKTSAKNDIVACAAETPQRSQERTLEHRSRLLAIDTLYHAATPIKLIPRLPHLLQFRA